MFSAELGLLIISLILLLSYFLWSLILLIVNKTGYEESRSFLFLSKLMICILSGLVIFGIIVALIVVKNKTTIFPKVTSGFRYVKEGGLKIKDSIGSKIDVPVNYIKNYRANKIETALIDAGTAFEKAYYENLSDRKARDTAYNDLVLAKSEFDNAKSEFDLASSLTPQEIKPFRDKYINTALNLALALDMENKSETKLLKAIKAEDAALIANSTNITS